jgi:hypothetical protein
MGSRSGSGVPTRPAGVEEARASSEPPRQTQRKGISLGGGFQWSWMAIIGTICENVGIRWQQGACIRVRIEERSQDEACDLQPRVVTGQAGSSWGLPGRPMMPTMGSSTCSLLFTLHSGSRATDPTVRSAARPGPAVIVFREGARAPLMQSWHAPRRTSAGWSAIGR